MGHVCKETDPSWPLLTFYTVTRKWIRSVKWLCLLKGVLCCHNSCAILKPLHCSLVQSARPNQHVSWKYSKGTTAKVSGNYGFLSLRAVGFHSEASSLAQPCKNKLRALWSGLRRGYFFRFRPPTPTPPHACTDQENCCQAVHGEEA